MKVILSSQAEKELKKLSKINQIAIAKKIRGIRDSIKAEGEEKLKGFQDIFRIRVGDYRLVYQKSKNRVYIVLIRHRKDVYRLVKQLFR
jgi:mRNA interferase RelE/StbE